MTRHWWLALMTVLALILSAPPAGAADQGAIQFMVTRGVAYLKGLQQPNGTWPEDNGRGSGSTSLAALALLECGVTADDPVMARAIEAIREASIRETGTYSLSLAIMFLDRLGDADDVLLIESMAVRLMAGQGSTGGWSYTCPSPNDTEMNRLATAVKNRNVLKGSGDAPRRTTGGRRVFRDLPVEIQRQIESVEAVRATRADGGFGDNSNTQFALLSLWVARRHGLPVEKALARVGARFRMSQRPGGGWSYNEGGNATPAMTCAGLLGLAVSYGIVEDAPPEEKNKNKNKADPGKDPQIRAGLSALGTVVGGPPQPFARRHGNDGHHSFYFLWSLERVGVIYGLETLGKKNWYNWGAAVLAATQMPDGSWQGAYARCGADTAFGLLFLRRANVARDLTATLRDRVADPGERVLHSGGVGGGALLGKEPASPFEGADKTPTTDRQEEASTALDTEAARLGKKLVEASGADQAVLLQKLKTGPGSEYTQALAAAIPKLNDATQRKARQALADRLSDMKTATLKQWLQYDDREIRRAAALACAMKDDKSTVPDLIGLLEDREPLVARAAHAALKSLTGQDLGAGVAAWREWWKRNGK